jgi:hypothetical protein
MEHRHTYDRKKRNEYENHTNNRYDNRPGAGGYKNNRSNHREEYGED